MNPPTHYVPAFTKSVLSAGQTILERAACGTYVAWDEIACAETEPACCVCRKYLGLTPTELTGEPRETDTPHPCS